MLGSFILQTVFTLFPILAYYKLDQRPDNFLRFRFITCVLLALFMVGLSGAYPIVLSDEYTFDFRYLAIVFCTVYCGVRVGLAVWAGTLVFQLFLATEDWLRVVMTATIHFFAAQLILIRFKPFWQRIGVLCMALISLLSIVLLELWMDTDTLQGLLASYGFWLLLVLYPAVALLAFTLIQQLIREQSLHEIIQQKEKLRVVSELTAGMAHELRNPMTVVRGFLQLITRSEDLDKMRGYAEMAFTEMERAESIISDYLNYAKPQPLQMKEIAIHEMLESLQEMMQAYSSMHGCDLQLEIEEPAYILGDPAKLKQVLINLAKNAIEAAAGLSDGRVIVSSVVQQEEVVIRITDNGVGMTKAELERLGKPFYSTKTKGTGLGLMVTFQIVEMMRGTLSFFSAKGKGTEATVRFPVIAHAEEEQPADGSEISR